MSVYKVGHEFDIWLGRTRTKRRQPATRVTKTQIVVDGRRFRLKRTTGVGARHSLSEIRGDAQLRDSDKEEIRGLWQEYDNEIEPAIRTHIRESDLTQLKKLFEGLKELIS